MLLSTNGLSENLARATSHDSLTLCGQKKHNFEDLKDALTHAHVLVYLDFSNPFTVEVNANGKGWGAVLWQEHRVIAFESRKFDAREVDYHVYDKESLAILHAFKKWHHYLCWTKIRVKTDHRTLIKCSTIC